MAALDAASSISVTVRVRPFTIREAAQLTKCDDGTLFLGDGSMAAAPTPKLASKGLRSVIKVVDDKCLIFDPPEDNPVQKFSRSVVPNMGKRVKDQTFGFDRVFDDNATQQDVYQATTCNLLDSVLDGFNATVFAYGATGCGKTHTITGTESDPGIIFLTMQELFEKIEERKDEKHTELSLSYLEIYNETIRDLLVPGGSKQGLMLREDANHAVSVSGLSTHHPKDVASVMQMVVEGNSWRTVSPTAANATSSRSHAVLQINIAQKDRNADVSEPHTMATLSIIDLAGSERASATKNRGERLVEGANINKSLLALGGCINALCDPRKKNHVPYRNSKLTRLLKFSLGGNCRTVMIVCVSPSSQHFDETQNTLRYANRAKNIQTKVTRNVYNVNRHVKDFLVKIDEQMALINELRAQQKDSEGAAFVKFKKQSEKRDGIFREASMRIRAAYDASIAERQEKANNMKKLRQVEKRIGILSAWIGAFDSVCDSREEVDMVPSLVSIRKTAQGILCEMENSRQHFHQRLEKSNWERAIDSALQNGFRQLADADGGSDSVEATSLAREVDLCKANAARDGLLEVLEVEKGADLGIMQMLLSAHMEIFSSLNDIVAMDPEDAVQHAKNVITRLLNSGSSTLSQVVKPDGSLNITIAVPPTKRGTPKRKKPLYVEDEFSRNAVPLMAPLVIAPQITASPMKASPRRRKAPVGKRGLSYTPKKKSPTKRSVRWRDDTESGALAEFEKTPIKIHSTPEVASTDESLPQHPPTSALADIVVNDENVDSSPIPLAPQPSLPLKAKTNRFEAGFLSKKNGSPPTITSFGSSDTDDSPLRVLETSKAANRASIQITALSSSDTTPDDSGNNSAEENIPFSASKAESAKIRAALKHERASMNASSRPSHGYSASESAIRTVYRRRSPTAAGSPPNENALFTAGHARRMVKSERDGSFASSVLSPRTAPVIKNTGARRTTINGPQGQHAGVGGLSAAQAMRLAGNGTVGSTPRGRESLATVTAKGSWR